MTLMTGGLGGGAVHSVLEWVSMCIWKSEWKGTFRSGLSYSDDHSILSTQFGYLNQQKCEKRYIFTKILNKMVPERVFSQSVWFFNLGTIQIRWFSELPHAHAYPRKVWVPHPLLQNPDVEAVLTVLSANHVSIVFSIKLERIYANVRVPEKCYGWSKEIS